MFRSKQLLAKKNMKPLSDFEMAFWRYAPLVSEMYFWVLFSAGTIFSVYAWKMTKCKAYWLIALYFFTPHMVLTASRISYYMNKEVVDAIVAEKNRELEEKMERGAFVQVDSPISLQLPETVLFVGLLMVYRFHRKGQQGD